MTKEEFKFRVQCHTEYCNINVVLVVCILLLLFLSKKACGDIENDIILMLCCRERVLLLLVAILTLLCYWCMPLRIYSLTYMALSGDPCWLTDLPHYTLTMCQRTAQTLTSSCQKSVKFLDFYSDMQYSKQAAGTFSLLEALKDTAINNKQAYR